MHRAIIHNGTSIGELRDAEVYAQIPLRGSSRAPFGTKLLEFDDTHIRLFRGGQEPICLSDGVCLILALGGKRIVRRLGGRLMVRVRIPQGRAVHDIVDQLIRGQEMEPLPISVDGQPAVNQLCREIIERSREVRKSIDCLPGRSLYKRIDTYLRLEQARDYLEQHFRDDPGTDVLAGVAAISRAHFIRLFGRLYGISPKQRVLDLKMEEARRLLRETRLSVWEVAEASGFGNRSAFQRMFKQRMGITPARFRSREGGQHAG